MTPRLFEPLRLRGIELRNRILVSPMCQYSCVDGLATDWHLVHLGARAVGGAALVCAEATGIEARGRISPDDLGLWNDVQAAALGRVAAFIRAQGAVPAIQLAHAGRKASTRAPFRGGGALGPDQGGWTPVAPSPLAFGDGWAVPEALDAAGIQSTIAAFAAATRRAAGAGFEFLELHAAHGYLLHEFLSPISNRRGDAWGGSLENRMHLVCETVEAVRAAWPDEHPLWLRISATDWVAGGWTIEDSIALARRVAPLGVDGITCSSGGNAPHADIPVGPGYQTPFAAALRSEAGIPTGAVGMITDSAQAEHILRTDQADVVALARQLLREPYWPLRAARELGYDLPWPQQYQRAKM